MKCVILRDVEQRCIASTFGTLVVANQMALSDAAHDPLPTLRYQWRAVSFTFVSGS